MNKRFLLGAFAASLLTAGCAHAPPSDIGVVDISRITANWPKFLNDENQLEADAAAIQHSKAPVATKQRQMNALNLQFQRSQTELTDDVRSAARQVASAKHLTYVFVKQFVGYGGIDITAAVEKVLGIVDTASPAP